MQNEFGFIKDLKKHFNLSLIGDDCAVIPKDSEHDFLITSDLMIQNIDFRLEWATPNHIGHKALAVSISDIAAMGGTPLYSFLSVGLPAKLWNGGFPGDFYEGFFDLARQVGVELSGGDISKTPELVVIDSTVVGIVPKGKAIMRSGAKPGDVIYVTGELGGAAGGLQLLENGVSESDGISGWQEVLIDKLLRPSTVNSGALLGIANSMIDISDGLASDLKHICDASGVGARIFAERIPVQTELCHLTDQEEKRIKLALQGGEDFELLFTADADKEIPVDEIPCHPIGEVTADTEVFEIAFSGSSARLEPGGYVHF